MRIRIVLAEDHDVMRQAIRAVLSIQPDWDVVAEAEDGREAVEQVRAFEPDVLLLDYNLPVLNGLEVLREITESRTKVLVLSMHVDGGLTRGVLDAGAKGYIVKSDAARELVPAINALVSNGTYLSSSAPNIS